MKLYGIQVESLYLLVRSLVVMGEDWMGKNYQKNQMLLKI